MNDDALQFLMRNNVDIDTLRTGVDCKIYNIDDINSLVSKNGIYKEGFSTTVSVADIVGDIGSETSDLFSDFGNLFESNGDGYHTRALGMLNYSSDEIMEQLSDSFEKEPICIQEADNGKYVISTNGRHRFMVLRAHYLIELQEVKDNLEAVQQLKEKYTIPVRLTQVDYLKTYSKFLIKCAYNKCTIMADVDENYNYTGNVEIWLGDERRVLNDDELVQFAKESFLTLSDNQKEIIEFLASRYDSFNTFMSQNFFMEMNYNQNLEDGKVR